MTVTGKGRHRDEGSQFIQGLVAVFGVDVLKGLTLGMQSLPHDTHIFGSFLLAKYVAVVALLCGRGAVAQKQKSGFFLRLLLSIAFASPKSGNCSDPI